MGLILVWFVALLNIENIVNCYRRSISREKEHSKEFLADYFFTMIVIDFFFFLFFQSSHTWWYIFSSTDNLSNFFYPLSSNYSIKYPNYSDLNPFSLHLSPARYRFNLIWFPFYFALALHTYRLKGIECEQLECESREARFWCVYIKKKCERIFSLHASAHNSGLVVIFYDKNIHYVIINSMDGFFPSFSALIV